MSVSPNQSSPMPTFLDNPLVGAIGNAMMAASPTGPVASVAMQLASNDAPPPPKVAPMKPPVQPGRAEEIRDSMNVRQRYSAKTPAIAKGNAGAGVGMNMPGVMSPDVLMHPAVQELLGQYGITPESLAQTAGNANPNLFVTDPNAFSKHPLLAGLLEHGLEGAAFTKGSNTIGEGISNVAQGLMDANSARAEKYNNMLMMPFAQASQVAQLRGTSLQQQFEQAQSARDEALVKHYGDMDATREELNDIKKQQAQTADKLARFHQNAGLVGELQKTPLTDDEQKAINDTIPDGGDIYDADPQVLSKVFSSAAQRHIDDQHQQALKVAGVNAKGRVDAAAESSSRSGNTASMNHTYDDAKTTYGKLIAEHDKFVSEANIDGTFVPPEGQYAGKTLVEGSPEWKSYIKELGDRTAQAKSDMDSAAAMSTPGTGMTSVRNRAGGSAGGASATINTTVNNPAPQTQKYKTWNQKTGRLE